MKRLVVLMNDGSHINIPADRMTVDGTSLFVWNGSELTAYLDLDAVVAAYLSEKG